MKFITNLDLQYTDNCFLKIICILNTLLIANFDIFQYLGIHVQFFKWPFCINLKFSFLATYVICKRKQNDPEKMSSNYQRYSVVMLSRPCSYRVVNCVKEYNRFTRKKINWVVQFVTIFFQFPQQSNATFKFWCKKSVPEDIFRGCSDWNKRDVPT